MEFPTQKIKASHSKSVFKPITENTSVYMDINTGLPLLFLLIKSTPLIYISISSVTEESVFLRRLYSTEVFNSVCAKSQRNF